MIEPYYKDSDCTLYCGRCEEILPQLPEHGDVCLTDQPYGTGWVRGGKSVGEFVAEYQTAEWDRWSTDWLKLVRTVRLAAFVPPLRLEEFSRCVGVSVTAYYRKTNVRPGGKDFEPIVIAPPLNLKMPIYSAYNGDSPYHPCQKPIEVMRWLCEELTEKGETVLDPFAGSCTTLVAAKLTGRRSIGIEMSEKYCELAVKERLNKPLPLFDEAGGYDRQMAF